MILIILASYLHLEIKVSVENRLTPSSIFLLEMAFKGHILYFKRLLKGGMQI